MPITIQNLSYIYSEKTPYEKRALDDITMTIEDGDFFGIIGRTGSGKSTLISHFNALTRVKLGAIFVNGMDLRPKKIDFNALRAKVGMVFQYPEYQLFDETVAKDVGFGPKNLKLSVEEIDTRVREAIELVGLNYDEIAERSPFELSGGQKRRVALAGVLAMRPEILVLDEPTAGLDPKGKREILELIYKIKSSMCNTIVMISHNMDEIAGCCNRIAVLEAGKLHGIFTPSELFGQRELILELGLDFPTVSKIVYELKGRGWDIDTGIVRLDELVDAVAKLKEGRCAI